MLRKMEKGEAEETSLLEFVKSKGLTLKGEGDRGAGPCWVGGDHHAGVSSLSGACWEPLSLSTTMCGAARASSSTPRAVACPSLRTPGRWTQAPSNYKTAALRSLEPESSLKTALRTLNSTNVLENVSWVV